MNLPSNKLEMKEEECITCGTKFKQWIHYYKEHCPLCQIVHQLEQLVELERMK